MKWIVTFDKSVGRDEVLEQLRALGCAPQASEKTQRLGSEEEVLSVEGPRDLAQLALPHRKTLKVYPNSKMEPI